MGGVKMLPEIMYDAKMPRKSPWGVIIEKPENKEARNVPEFRMPKSTLHQIPQVTYPQPPSVWRTHRRKPRFIQPRIVEQPNPASLKKQCMYRKKLEKEKSKSIKKKSDFFLSKFTKLAKPKQKGTYIWDEKVEPERLKALINHLSSSVELDQLYAAQALGHLGVDEEYVISALYNTLQECSSLPLQYEVARSLALLGCLEASVMKVLIRHLKEVSLHRREDALIALKMALQAWSTLPKFEGGPIGAQSSLIRNLQRLVNLQDPLDSTAFNAAICLGYLDKSNPIARETMFMCLAQKDWKKRMQALVMLVSQMGLVDAVIIQSILEQLRLSPVYKHRADSAQLLGTVGLEAIQEEELEEDVFDVLLEKLYEEPHLVVRQSVAMAIEDLEMKKQVWDIVEKQLKDEREDIRRQAVISLGVLGIRLKSVFFTLLEMLELDTSEDVRIQVIRTFATLGMNNVHVRKSLMHKEQTEGILARESSKALKILDKLSGAQKYLMLQSYRIQ
ncbi:protein HEATR9 [Hemicordylus capensis]|uniref:protein HEATR9 n=1 Tax=Hemicordylus capensis TaxID=884348 RepID=UPI0023038FB1|nr:protein HEATR9 [Hemicordylus capensis]